MADRLANIDMDIGASIQDYASEEANIVEATTTFLNNDVNHWLETSHADYQELQEPVLTSPNKIISRQESARRCSAFRGLVLPST